MALNKNALADALKTVFQTAKDNSWSTDQVADGLAAAIDAFIRQAEVGGVNVKVTDNGGNPIGNGTQVGKGSLQ